MTAADHLPSAFGATEEKNAFACLGIEISVSHNMEHMKRSCTKSGAECLSVWAVKDVDLDRGVPFQALGELFELAPQVKMLTLRVLRENGQDSQGEREVRSWSRPREVESADHRCQAAQREKVLGVFPVKQLPR
jgi:hypothetical protein